MILAFLLATATALPVAAPADSGWSFTDRVLGASDKAISHERSQRILGEIAVCVGFADPGNHDKVLTIDAPEKAPRLIYAIARPDTLMPKPLSACPQVKPDPGFRTYVVVVRQGGEVPDSLSVVLADESSFWIRYERERKRP